MTRKRRIITVLALLASALFISSAFVLFAFFHTFYPSPPEAIGPPPVNLADAQRQDLDYLVQYFDYNRSYAPEALQRAKRLREKALTQAGSMSPAQFDLAVARIVALANNGHSRVHPGPLSRLNNHLPCHLYHFDDGFHVLRARGSCEALLGAKITAIDSQPIDMLADKMFVYFGGPRNHYDQFASVFFLESPALLNAAGLIVSGNLVTIHAVAQDGSERDVELAAEPADAKAPHAYSDEYLSPEGIEREPADWKAFLASDAKIPAFLRDYRNPFHAELWADKGVYYVQFRSNSDEPGNPIGAFVDRIRREIETARPRFIVLDLRLDQGGNFVTTAGLMKQLTRLSASIEHVYVLTSAWTFSAGNVSFALVKEHGDGKVTVLGAAPGDRLRLWAEGGSMVLPNAGLSIGYATGLHDYSRPCEGQPGCFWTMYFYPMHIASLEPDVPVRYTFDDYANLRDPLVEKALDLIATATHRG